jgi:hypothetical protein
VSEAAGSGAEAEASAAEQKLVDTRMGAESAAELQCSVDDKMAYFKSSPSLGELADLVNLVRDSKEKSTDTIIHGIVSATHETVIHETICVEDCRHAFAMLTLVDPILKLRPTAKDKVQAALEDTLQEHERLKNLVGALDIHVLENLHERLAQSGLETLSLQIQCDAALAKLSYIMKDGVPGLERSVAGIKKVLPVPSDKDAVAKASDMLHKLQADAQTLIDQHHAKQAKAQELAHQQAVAEIEKICRKKEAEDRKAADQAKKAQKLRQDQFAARVQSLVDCVLLKIKKENNIPDVDDTLKQIQKLTNPMPVGDEFEQAALNLSKLICDVENAFDGHHAKKPKKEPVIHRPDSKPTYEHDIGLKELSEMGMGLTSSNKEDEYAVIDGKPCFRDRKTAKSAPAPTFKTSGGEDAKPVEALPKVIADAIAVVAEEVKYTSGNASDKLPDVTILSTAGLLNVGRSIIGVSVDEVSSASVGSIVPLRFEAVFPDGFFSEGINLELVLVFKEKGADHAGGVSTLVSLVTPTSSSGTVKLTHDKDGKWYITVAALQAGTYSLYVHKWFQSVLRPKPSGSALQSLQHISVSATCGQSQPNRVMPSQWSASLCVSMDWWHAFNVESDGTQTQVIVIDKCSDAGSPRKKDDTQLIGLIRQLSRTVKISPIQTQVFMNDKLQYNQRLIRIKGLHKPHRVRVQAIDWEGQPIKTGGERLAGQSTRLHVTSTLGDVRDLSNGTYICDFTPLSTGLHYLSFEFNDGFPIGGVFSVFVEPEAGQPTATFNSSRLKIMSATVKDRPVSGACVSVIDPVGQVHEAFSGPDGVCALDSLSAGFYGLSILAAGYQHVTGLLMLRDESKEESVYLSRNMQTYCEQCSAKNQECVRCDIPKHQGTSLPRSTLLIRLSLARLC